MPNFHVLDLHFKGYPQGIGAFAIPHENGVILVESGPGSTLPALACDLERLGYRLEDVTDVLLTHIHLDHAGAAGALARRGARVHVHPVGAPHMANPERLLASAKRLYQDEMDVLWGEFLPVPEDRLVVPEKDQPFTLHGHTFVPLDTPGHASHHFAYLWNGEVLFTGDIAGVRLPGSRHVRLPTPPPEFHLETWQTSVEKLLRQPAKTWVLTHFGPVDDPQAHGRRLLEVLDSLNHLLERIMPQNPDLETLTQALLDWTWEIGREDGLTPEEHHRYEQVNPTWMSALGVQRYWRKFRAAS